MAKQAPVDKKKEEKGDETGGESGPGDEENSGEKKSAKDEKKGEAPKTKSNEKKEEAKPAPKADEKKPDPGEKSVMPSKMISQKSALQKPKEPVRKILVPSHQNPCDLEDQAFKARKDYDFQQTQTKEMETRAKANEAKKKIKDSRMKPQWRRAHFYRMIKNVIGLFVFGFFALCLYVFALVIAEQHVNEILGFNTGKLSGISLVVLRFQDVWKEDDKSEARWWLFMVVFAICGYATVRIYLQKFELRHLLLSLHCERRYQKTQALQELRRYEVDRTFEDSIFEQIKIHTKAAPEKASAGPDNINGPVGGTAQEAEEGGEE